MRINLARKHKDLRATFFNDHIRRFADEFDFSNISNATAYVTSGKQGLRSFVDFINGLGYKAEMYYLEPNKDLFTNVGDDWAMVSRTSFSYGLVIPDDDPKLVEFKLKH